MIHVSTRLAFVLIVPLGLMVSACGSDGKVESRDGAAGEILPGSASDAMIALDAVRSQAPLAPRAVASGGAGGQPGQAPDGTTEGEAAADAGTAPGQGDSPVPGPGENAMPAAE